MITGGQSYIVAAYAFAYLALFGYGGSLVWRRKQAWHLLTPDPKDSP